MQTSTDLRAQRNDCGSGDVCAGYLGMDALKEAIFYLEGGLLATLNCCMFHTPWWAMVIALLVGALLITWCDYRWWKRGRRTR